MRTNKDLALIQPVLVAVLVAGYDKKPKPPNTVAMPEANAESCMPGNMAKVNASVLQQCSDVCFRLGTFTPSHFWTW